MKRKRGCGRRKPNLPPAVGAEEGVVDFVSVNTQDDCVPDYYDAELDARIETETPPIDSIERRPQAGLQRSGVVNVTMVDSMSSFPGVSDAVSANPPKKSRNTMTKSSRGLTSSNVKASSNTELVQGDKAHRKDPKLSHHDPLYEEQELNAALTVIRKVMKMDAAEPFNVPVDPIAQRIPDYFDVIDIPMDFGTICKNLENGVKYKNSKDVFKDVQYIWDNCSKYNYKGHYVLELMKRVKKNFTKYWTEAGLYAEQQQETNGKAGFFAEQQQELNGEGHLHVPPVESTMRYSTQVHGSTVDSISDYPRHQHIDPSQCHSHQPSGNYRIPCQPQKRPWQYHLNSGQQQTSQPLASRNGGSAEATLRRNPCGHMFPEDSNPENSTDRWQNQPGLSQPQPHQHQPSSSYSQPFQLLQGSCQCQPCFVQPLPTYPQGATYIASADLHPMETTERRNPWGHRCTVGLMDENPTHLQQNRIGMSQPQVHQHQPTLSRSQASQPQQRSFPCQPIRGQQEPSPPYARTDLGSIGHFCSQPPVESMIRSSKRGPKSSGVPMADCASHEQQDQIAPSQILPHQPSASYELPHQLQQGTFEVQLNSGQAQPSVELGSEGYTRSLLPVESMIRCNKRGIRCPVGPMNDYLSSEQQDQTVLSPMSPHQSSASSGQPHESQTGQGTCQVQNPSSSQPQPFQLQSGTEMGRTDSSGTRRRPNGRGPTRCLDLWNMEGKISIATNELGQPIGLEAPKLTNFLGTIARNGHMAPLNYVDWRAVPDENKEKMWEQVQSKFDIDPISESWVMKSLGKKWKDWKAELKASHYNTHQTDEERLADRDERVLPDQWRILVSFWNSKEAKERSVTNKASRAQLKIIHTTGRKSFARVREEQRAKRPDRKEPSRAELFILTRTRKNGRPVNKATSELISQLHERAAQQPVNSQNGNVDDDVFSQVMGQERHGRVRTYGLGPTPSDFGGPRPSRAEALKMVSHAQADVRDMKERMTSMEQSCAQMAAQMATMMSMVSKMQNNFPDEHASPVRTRLAANVSSNPEGSPQLQVCPSSSVQGVPSHQRRAMKGRKTQGSSINQVSRERS